MSDVQRLLTEHLDIWTTAETGQKSGRGRSSGNGETVYGVKKLRELILELAVRGKLVPQDPKDEPASELLKRIKVERAKLIAEGKIKKEKTFPSSPNSEKLFFVPSSWGWVNLGSLGCTQTGATPKKNEKSEAAEYLPFIKPGDIYANYVDYENEKVSRSNADGNVRTAAPGSVLMVCIGTIGKCNFIDRECSFNQQINAITPFLVDPKFILCVFRSLYFFNQAWSRSSSTTIAILNKGNWEDIPVPVPPLAEQHRIVAKVDELMALCDQLETRHNNAADAHEKLVTHLLGTLTQLQDAADFNANWQRIAEHFDTLFTTEHSIDTLKQTLLQLAVMGKLVPQDPNDEPASELLKRIQAEKAKLIAAGKIKKEKPLPPISEEEKPFALPVGWAWARFSELGEFARGKSKHRPRNDPALFNPGLYPLVQTGEVARAGRVIHEVHSKYSEFGLAQSRIWSKGTLCITIAANIADSAMLGFDACFPDSVVGFLPTSPIDSSEYFLFFMKTVREDLQRFAPSTAQKNINLEILGAVLIPVPPHAEQVRIIVKVNELLSLCDHLKSRLTDATQLKQKLANALVEQALH